jgi:hypothetical protein
MAKKTAKKPDKASTRKPDKDWSFKRDGSGRIVIPRPGRSIKKKRGDPVEWRFRNQDQHVPITIELTDWHDKRTGVQGAPFEEAPPYAAIAQPNGDGLLRLHVRKSLTLTTSVTYEYTVKATCRNKALIIQQQLDPDLIIEGSN